MSISSPCWCSVTENVYFSAKWNKVDDGTAVVECIQRAATTSSKHDIPETMRPSHHIGVLVQVVGKVIEKYETRQVQVATIERCKSFTDEPRHWQEVRTLHTSFYSAPGPFTIPNVNAKPEKEIIESNTTLDIPSSPSTVYSAISSSAPSSPTKPKPERKSPPKLRHPSRLRSQDLTGNAFRIYMKHYMDHAPTLVQEEYSILGSPLKTSPSTPTKSSYQYNNDKTPQPSRIRTIYHDQTPVRGHQTSPKSDATTEFYGFTLSYLRRVPVLADMARRVVEAEAKRRAREEHKKAKAKSKLSTGPTPTPKLPSTSQSREPITAKVKRLFQWAIIQLVREGNIILWDGPVRSISSARNADSSTLWKMGSATPADVIGSTFSLDGLSQTHHDDNYLSDPDETEEAYISIMPNFIAKQVEDTILVLSQQRSKGYAPNQAEGAPLSSLTHAINPHGVTKEQILAWLKRDDRWQFVGDWSIEDGLQTLSEESRAWCVGKGRWVLTL
ncbi:hypothetical protein AX16_004407 [Volvariella volvacea WC 439]|nr:hypothetical protein AX16_004407 [Volvariella volvacea WC 439]